MDWINITGRFPAFDEDVLVFGEGKIVIAKLVTIVTTKDGASFDFQYDNQPVWFNVTHWMPLPQPPTI